MIVAGCGHFVHVVSVCFMGGQFTVYMEAEVANDTRRLDLGRADLDCVGYLVQVDASTVNAFKAQLDKFWTHQAVK